MRAKSLGVSRDALLVGLILVLAVLHGLMYVFLMPPWQHYDEPNHFEYVWLTAHLPTLPTVNSYDPKLSRQVLRSMIQNGFYDHEGVAPVIGPPSVKVRIPGYYQLEEPPLYYIIASLPLRLVSTRSIITQLYVARLVSLFFLLITLISAWGMTSELVPPGHPLRWMLPLTVALTPAFVDLNTAVNNDAAAIAVASLFLWLGVRLIARGFSWLDFFVLTFLGVLTNFIKQTSMVVLIIYPVILLFAALRGRWRKIIWVSLAIGLLSALIFTLRWDDTLAWYRSTSQKESTRIQTEKAPVGEFALVVKAGADVTPPHFPEIFQNLPIRIGKELAGEPVTFGYWIWSDQDQFIRAPILKTVSQPFSEKLKVTSEPKFFAFQAILPQDTDRIWVYLTPEAEQPGVSIYYDGLILVAGRRPISETPQFDTIDGQTGTWGGQPFINLLRNASAELAGPRLVPLVDDFAARILPDQGKPSLLLNSLIDREGTSDLYPVSAWNLFRTFWARFGWGHVPILGDEKTYRVLAVFTLLGIIGAILGAVRAASRVPWDLVATLGLVSIAALFLALTRGGTYLALAGFYYPTARHFYPVILPLLLLLTSGWLNLFQIIHIFWQRVIRKESITWDAPVGENTHLGIQFSFFVVILVALNVLSEISVSEYYHLF